MQSIAPVIGIDLGTCYSCVYSFQKGQLQALPITSDTNLIASHVSMQNGEISYGRPAVRMGWMNTISYKEVKCIIGRTKGSITEYNDRRWPFELRGDFYPYLESRDYDGNILGYAYPEFVYGLFLQHLANLAADALGMEIQGVVITVPAFFTAVQLHATLQAARLVGLNVLRVLPEPCAAALPYCLEGVTSRYILVYDLGGGTFDVTIIKNTNGDYRVINTKGNHSLGGSDFDYLLAEYIRHKLEIRGITFLPISRLYQKLVYMAEQAKIRLNYSTSTHIELNDLCSDDQLVNEVIDIDRQLFESLILDKLKQTIRTCHECLDEVNIKLGREDTILLVGGSSRIPLVEKLLEQKFPDTPIKMDDPDEVVAKGACITAVKSYDPTGNTFANVSVSQYSIFNYYYSIDNGERKMLVEKDTSLNTIVTRLFEVKTDDQKLYVWQYVDNEFICVGWVDIVAYLGVMQLKVSFNSCNEIELCINGTKVQLFYFCELMENEKEKLTRLSSLWRDIRKAKNTLRYNPEEGAEPYLTEVEKISMSVAFRVPTDTVLEYIDQVHNLILQFYGHLIK